MSSPVILLAALIFICTASAQLFMVIEYDSQAETERNIMNLTMTIADLQATLIGCADGFYDLKLSKNITCLECVCDVFHTGRVEDFVAVNW
jgi:hypothetical protein